jgi:hypothetical protein
MRSAIRDSVLMTSRFTALALVVWGTSAACTSDLDATGAGKACSASGACASGYLCDVDRGVCVAELGSTGGTAGAGGIVDSGSGGAADVQLPDADCPTPATYFLDADGDGFGRGDTTAPGCELPSGWAEVGGDCADDVSGAFPGQTAFFAEGYPVLGGVSFDFDCDGIETGDQSQNAAAPECSDDAGCDAKGYVGTSRTGAGVDPICGSDQLRECSIQLLSCQEDVSTVEPKRCR